MKKILRILAVTGIISLLLFISMACATAPLKSIAASPDKSSLVPGGAQQLTIAATYNDGTTENVTVKSTYKSSNEKVAAVTKGGLITGVANGSANITVSYHNGKVTQMVTVPITVAFILKSIAASPDKVSLTVKGTQQLTTTATYTDGTRKNVTAKSTYKSSNTKIATVTKGGLITGIAAGSSTITASYTEGKITKTVTISVTVKAAPSLKSITPLTNAPIKVSLAVKATYQLTISALDTAGNLKNVTAKCTFKSSNTKVATVTKGGLITGVAAGSSTIAASYTEGKITKTVTISVTVK